MGLFNLVKPDALQTFNTMTSNPTEEAELYSIADTFEGVDKISRLEKRAVGAMPRFTLGLSKKVEKYPVCPIRIIQTGQQYYK
jgi:hypothetical protein